MYAFWVGLPGSMSRSVTRRSCAHVSIALPQNSEPLSLRTHPPSSSEARMPEKIDSSRKKPRVPATNVA